MTPEFVRHCPACGERNAPEVMRCACGVLLAGLDLVRASLPAETSPAAPINDSSAEQAAPVSPGCPYGDCGQPNPPDSTTCLYCNRPLAAGATLTLRNLVALPSALRDRYRVERIFPATGAEADLLLVVDIAGQRQAVAKLYRQGIQPKAAVRERLATVDPAHRVQLFEAGHSDERAYEVMEYCPHGNLRDWLGSGTLGGERLRLLIRELAEAIAALHKAGLVHRDLKPDNILIRNTEPLDLVLTDFGISSVSDATQRFTGAARTLPYAAPESLSGVIDHKTDWWALGLIALEAATGRHPFAGLSEAVILHHLATRGVSLDGVADADLRKLLKGLLQRDPRKRWGKAEVDRWLSGDHTLAEPRDGSDDEAFREPYRMGKEACFNAQQLAVALARHWAAGVSDLDNGQLLAWFRDVQKDHDAVRLLIDLRQSRTTHVDVQLLTFILHLAPGIPPVWRGQGIELSAILRRADAALKGDAEAARWLDALYQHRVLEAYARAGNAEMAEIVQRWSAASDRFADTWSRCLDLLKGRAPKRLPEEIVDFDEVMFGKQGPSRPPLLAMHPRLLAVAYDPAWSERLRQRLLRELTGLSAACPWLAELGDPQTMDAATLLVIESLLPEARQVVERQAAQEKARRDHECRESRQLREETATLLARVRYRATEQALSPAGCEELNSDLQELFGLLTRLRALGNADTAIQDARRVALRAEPLAMRLQEILDALAERRTANSGWMSLQTAGAVVAAFLILPMVFGNWALNLFLLLVAGVAAWRWLPLHLLKRQIRELGSQLPEPDAFHSHP